MAHTLPALLTRFSSSLLWPPYRLVRPRRGKKFATATPTSAFVATSACSACWMSGRRSRSCDGRPAGTSGGGGSPSEGGAGSVEPGLPSGQGGGVVLLAEERQA